METRSKTQRETMGADAEGLGSTIGEAAKRPARDPSPPVLTPIRFQATPVPSEDILDDAEQRQEQSTLTAGSGTLIYITNFGEKGAWAYPLPEDCPNFVSTPYYLRNG